MPENNKTNQVNKEPIIKIKNLSKKFEDKNIILNNLSINIYKGDVICILGLSGSGKSTFLRCLNLLEQPSSGQIFLDNIDILDKDNKKNKLDINSIRKKVGMVFQQFNLFANLNVYQNLILAPKKIYKKPEQELKNQAIDLLKRVNLLDKMNFYPSRLSGGQKQRIAIVRALMMNPEILLFDEPTSALDPTMVNEVLKVIAELAQSKMTMLVVTHEMSFARKVANRILFLNSGEFIFDGLPKDFFDINNNNSQIKKFLSAMSHDNSFL